jgi:hypothetical protein
MIRLAEATPLCSVITAAGLFRMRCGLESGVRNEEGTCTVGF